MLIHAMNYFMVIISYLAAMRDSPRGLNTFSHAYLLIKAFGADTACCDDCDEIRAPNRAFVSFEQN
jgi:hypothetical protein